MRAVLDPNVLISALLSPHGAPARLVQAWVDGAFELVVSPELLAELERALAYPKLRKRLPATDAEEAVDWLRRSAVLVDDPGGESPVRSSDPGDDYLLALAAAQRSALVSGDKDLLSLRGDDTPIYAVGEFLALLAGSGVDGRRVRAHSGDT